MSKITTAEQAYLYVLRNGTETDLKKEIESIVAPNAQYARMYAELIKAPFPAGERAISKDAEQSYLYARFLNRRFRLGEKIIAREPAFAYQYALHVLKKRFPKGEKAIAKSSIFGFMYLCNIIKDNKLNEPFEDAIASDPTIAIEYCQKILKWSRFPKAEATIRKSMYWENYLTKVLNEPKVAYQYLLKNGNQDYNVLCKIIAKSAVYSYLYAKHITHYPFLDGEETIAKDPTVSFLYALNILQDRFEAGEEVLSKSPLAEKYVKMIVGIESLHAHSLKLWAVSHKRFPMLETFVLARGDAHDLYWFARDVIKERFLAAESKIIKSPIIAAHYAQFIVKGPWPEAETSIATNVQASLNYANFTKVRFRAAETAILNGEMHNLYEYIIEVIKGPWPEAERRLKEHALYAARYAEEILRRRWPEAESVIRLNSEAACNYAIKLIKGRWVAAENCIARDPYMAIRYVTEVLKDRFIEAEEAIIGSYYHQQYRKFLLSIGKYEEFRQHELKIETSAKKYDLVNECIGCP